MENFGVAVVVSLVAGIIFVLIPVIAYSKGAMQGNDLINACEEKLPRNQYCELYAKPMPIERKLK